MKLIFTLILSFSGIAGFAQKISGTVKDEQGKPLSFASVFIKNTTRGTTANEQGYFSFAAEPGVYTLVCRHIGFAAREQQVTVSEQNVTIQFVLAVQTIKQQTAVVKGGAEDPAYAIMRKAIKKRTVYNNEVKTFICDAYIKSNARMMNAPRNMFKEEKDPAKTLDSIRRSLLFLTESVTRVYYNDPDMKLEVLSGRNSVSRNGFGINFPSFINFYVNNVDVGRQFNPRGFVSPVHDNAIHYYKFKYLGYFTEDGKDINRIQVMPRRNNEPCFTGIINIADDSWRIHSLDLSLNRAAGIELLDSFAIRQQFVPMGEVHRLKDNVIFARFKQMGFDLQFNLVNIYQNYQLNPVFPPKFFNKMLMKYDTAFNKKDSLYWEQNRPLPLDTLEQRDYREKDSMRNSNSVDSIPNKAYIDSMRKKYNRISFNKLLFLGYRYGYPIPHKNYNLVFNLQPLLLTGLEFNTAEGYALSIHPSWELSFREKRRKFIISPHARYGVSNKHINAWLDLLVTRRDSSVKTWNIQAGKRVFQFNHDNPVQPLRGSVMQALNGRNFMKIYEAYTGSVVYTRNNLAGVEWSAGVEYEDRFPLDNTIGDTSKITPNYPFEIIDRQFTRHQAFSVRARISYQPGVKYIQFPNARMSIPSSKPVFSLEYTKGIRNILGSDTDYDKWRFSISGNRNMKLAGTFNYRVSAGGFLNTRLVPVQDMQHFNGNQIIFASDYLNSFQLAPYYANSTTAKLYGIFHAEHHFNGLLTNKIPLFNRLKWHLTAGTNIFYVNRNNNYAEVFAGLENIFKLFRVDVVYGYKNGVRGDFGVRIGAGGLLGRMLQRPGSR